MKKFLSILLCCMLLSSTAYGYAGGLVDTYDKFLEQNDNPNYTLQEKADMMETFIQHLKKREIVVDSSENETITDSKYEETNNYTVYQILGGNGGGHNDGDLEDATLWIPNDMVVDNKGYIYFIDPIKNSVRVYDPYEKKITTLLVGNDYLFGIKYTKNKNTKIYNGDKFIINKLYCKAEDNSLYVAGYYNTSSSEVMNAIFCISPDIKLIAYDYTEEDNKITPMDFIKMDNKNNIFFSERCGYSPNSSKILKAKLGRSASLICGGTCFTERRNNSMIDSLKGDTESVVTNDSIYVFSSFSSVLDKINRYPVVTEKIINSGCFSSTVTSHNDKFYIAKENSIYEVGTDGNINKIVDKKDLGLPEKSATLWIQKLYFDTKGNLYVTILDRKHVGGKTLLNNIFVKKVCFK